METGGCIELYQKKNTLTGETSVRAFEGTLKVATGDDQAIYYYKVATSTSPDTPPSLGLYAAGSTVTVAAPVIPDKGIRWTADGVTLEESEQHQVSFTMPGNPVTLTASYHDKMEQQPLVIHAPSTVSYGDEFTLTTTGGSGSGAVSWSATGSATVDGNGKVTINGVGETTITATMAEDNDYKQAVATWTFTPQKADLSPDNYTAPVGNTGLTYNTTGQALVKAGSVVANATKMQYSLDGTTWGDTIPTGTDAKTYRVYWRVLGDANHKDFIPTEPISVTISSKVVTNPIIEVLGSYTYTGSAIEPNVTVKDSGTTIPTGEYTVSYKNNRNAGTATVTITNKNDSNYTVSGSTTFPIAKATYGDQIARGEAKYGMTGTVDLKDLILAGSTVKIGTVEDHDGVLDGTPEINGKILQFKYKNALNLAGKSAKISVSVTDCTNYLPYDITVTVTVNEKERPVVTAPTAQTLTYNGTEQILIAAGSTTGGTMQYSLDGADWSATLPTARDADTYTVYYRVVGNTDYTDVAAAQISVTVNKAVLTVTAEDKTAVVGSAIPLLTYTVSGLYGQDALTTEPMLICTPNMDKAGTYSITADSADASRNYTIRYKAGTLTVSPWTPPVPTFPTIGNTGTPGGSSTETVTKPDGSTTITETKKDGTVTETTIRADGSTTKTETKKDGSSITENRDANGSTVTVKTDTAGKVEASATVSDEAVEDAIRENRPVTIPMEVCAEQTRENVPTIDVSIPPSVEEVKIEIPVTNANAGTVVVIVREDGTEEVVKNTVSTGNGVQVTISDPVTVKVVDNSKKFDDVSESYWGREAVDFVSSRELFSGVSETEYAPEESMTRAMLVTVLARLDGQETEGGKTWYEKSMAWATSLQITDGIAPNRAITREQLATMLYRYAGYPVASNDINGFVDSDSVSDWAVRAMQWAVETGIISGVDNLLNPQGEATRAQVAVMLMRFMEVMN